MTEKKLHIVALNIPFPPDYGGVIDIFYKIKALSQSGVKIILHAFQYGRAGSDELEKICHEVYYYKRKTGFFSNLSILPYIVFSRRSKKLLDHLKNDNFPILFEGLHSCYYLDHSSLRNRKKLVRMHNIEHDYYFSLAKSTLNPLKSLFYLIEGLKLKIAERKLVFADMVAAISQNDMNYLQGIFHKLILLNPFHSNDTLLSKPGRGEYILYHGNLSVEENKKAVVFLIRNVFTKLDKDVIIAGKDPDEKLLREINDYKWIHYVANPSSKAMTELIRNAHINVLISFQSTGIKLKVIDSLFKGRFCIVNTEIIENTGLESVCVIANSAKEIKDSIEKIFLLEFTQKMIRERKEKLQPFNNANGAKLLNDLLFS